jgi:hypothetical protein
LVPENATKKTHGAERALYKTAVLAINYEIGAESLAAYINQPIIFARHLIGLHHELFADYWRWSNRAVNHAMLVGWQSTVFDWRYRLPPNPRPTAVRNFPIQSNAAEMLRLGHSLISEHGLKVCAPIHDAYLVIAHLDELEHTITQIRECMVEASRVILGGFELFVDAKVIRYPDRYSSTEGEAMWNLVTRLLGEIEASESVDRQYPEVSCV